MESVRDMRSFVRRLEEIGELKHLEGADGLNKTYALCSLPFFVSENLSVSAVNFS